MELCDLEKEYALLHACLQLAQKLPQRSSHMASLSRTLSASRRADEVVGLLVDAGLFDVAVNICQLFDIKMDVVFEHLTLRSPVECLCFSLLGHFELTRSVNRHLVKVLGDHWPGKGEMLGNWSIDYLPKFGLQCMKFVNSNFVTTYVQNAM